MTRGRGVSGEDSECVDGLDGVKGMTGECALVEVMVGERGAADPTITRTVTPFPG